MTPIAGPAQCGFGVGEQWATDKGAPPYWVNLARTYWDQAAYLGVRADVAWAQACKETGFGWFGGVITPLFHNPCGLKTRQGGGNYDPDAHQRFPDWATGIRAHLEHLHLYAIGEVDDPVDPRHFTSIAGTARHVEDLSARWAPSRTYHESIVRYVEEMASMSGFLDWLPGVLRSAGVGVYVMPGAESRTTRSSGLAVRGIVWHHTATGPNWADGHVAALLAKGRIDLAGPLSQVGIERDGTWVIVALGRANHNGFGEWGNDSIGLEFYNDGVGEAWPAPQVRSGVIGTAAICTYLGKSIHDVKGHRETDPRRKIDPAGLSMKDIRRQIDVQMRQPNRDQEDDDMGWTSLIHAAFDAKHPRGLTAEHKAKVWFWGDVLARKAVAGDNPLGAYQWIKANEPDLL